MILSKVAGVFDPIGVGAAILVKSKIAMQELWQLGLSCDKDVPSETRKKWVKLFEEINTLIDVKFNRCLTPAHVAVVFCNTSRLAFGMSAHAGWELQDGKFNARSIAAKSRAAPLKEMRIPCLELQVAVLASRLARAFYKNLVRSLKGYATVQP